jgi:hypothetical protein
MAKLDKDEVDAGPEVGPEVIRYVGTADVRMITLADFKAAGVESEDAGVVIWSADNNWVIAREELAFLDDDQFRRLIREDPYLRVDSA